MLSWFPEKAGDCVLLLFVTELSLGPTALLVVSPEYVLLPTTASVWAELFVKRALPPVPAVWKWRVDAWVEATVRAPLLGSSKTVVAPERIAWKGFWIGGACIGVPAR